VTGGEGRNREKEGGKDGTKFVKQKRKALRGLLVKRHLKKESWSFFVDYVHL